MRKITLTKAIAILLLISLTSSLLIACNKKQENQNENTDTSIIDPGTENTSDDSGNSAPEEIFNFISGGKTTVTIGRPASSEPDYVFDCFADLRSTIKSKTGINLNISYEKTSTPEILVGASGREVLDELSQKYKTKDFFVGVYKNKLVIYGSTESTLKRAINKFIEILDEKVAANKSEINFSSLENHEFLSSNYVVNSLNIAGNSVQKYTIVYSKSGRYSEELFALKLKTRLESSVGFPITVCTDDKATENSLKILVGKTKFSTDASVASFNYKFEVKGGNLIFCADSIEGYDSMVKYFGSKYLTQKDVSLEEGFSENKVVDTAAINLKTEKTGDIRVIFNNILGNCDESKYPLDYRTRSVTELLSSFNADVLGLQECSPSSRALNIVGLLKNYGFEEVPVNPTNTKKSNYTPLFYNPKTLKVIACDYVYYAGTLNDGGSKSITWAVFETLSDKTQFAVCSTHFFYQSADIGGDAGRTENAKTLVATAKMIAEKYNVPVIAGGDLNTRTTTSIFEHLLSNGFSNIQPIAKRTDSTRTHHAYPEFSSKLGYYSIFTAPEENTYASKAIDHALVYNKGNLTFNLFDVVTEDFALMSSDHCPLVIDFTFSK